MCARTFEQSVIDQRFGDGLAVDHELLHVDVGGRGAVRDEREVAELRAAVHDCAREHRRAHRVRRAAYDFQTRERT